MNTINFNTNDHVLVQLTERGKACLRENYDKLKWENGGDLPFEFRLPDEDAEGWSRWQLWDLMRKLGKHVVHGLDSPFEIVIKIELPRE